MKSSSVCRFAVSAALGVVLLGGGVAAAQTLDKALGDVEDALDEVDRATGGDVGTGSVQGDGLYNCDAHRSLVLDGKKLEQKALGDKKTKLVVDASGHCQVVIRELTLTGFDGIRLSGHSDLVIENSTITAKKDAIHISGHATVTIRNSTITGKRAIVASGFAEIRYDKKSKLKGKVAKSGFVKVNKK